VVWVLVVNLPGRRVNMKKLFILILVCLLCSCLTIKRFDFEKNFKEYETVVKIEKIYYLYDVGLYLWFDTGYNKITRSPKSQLTVYVYYPTEKLEKMILDGNYILRLKVKYDINKRMVNSYPDFIPTIFRNQKQTIQIMSYLDFSNLRLGI
jgi:hypothetical protein